MTRKANIVFTIYFLVFSAFVVANLVNLLSPGAFLYTYYHVLISFDKIFAYRYYLSVMAAVVNVVNLIPLLGYTFRKRFWKPKIWQGVFWARIIADVIGHFYEIDFIKSSFFADVWLGIVTVVFLTTFILPSYVGCFRYAFRQDKLIL